MHAVTTEEDLETFLASGYYMEDMSDQQHDRS